MLIFCFLIGCQIFILTYLAGVPVMYYAALGAGAAGVAGLAWPHLPFHGQPYLALFATSIRSGIGILLTLQLFIQTSEVINNIFNNTAQLIGLGNCIVEGGRNSMKIIKRSILQESDVKNMISGISSIAANANDVLHSEELLRTISILRLNLEESFQWLESKTSFCKNIVLLPYKQCLKQNSNTIWICEPLKTIANANCGKSNDRVMEYLFNIRERITRWMSKALE